MSGVWRLQLSDISANSTPIYCHETGYQRCSNMYFLQTAFLKYIRFCLKNRMLLFLSFLVSYVGEGHDGLMLRKGHGGLMFGKCHSGLMLRKGKAMVV